MSSGLLAPASTPPLLVLASLSVFFLINLLIQKTLYELRYPRVAELIQDPLSCLILSESSSIT